MRHRSYKVCTAQGAPVAVICIVQHLGEYYRGIALCSLDEPQWDSVRGLSVAASRADEALVSGRAKYPIAQPIPRIGYRRTGERFLALMAARSVWMGYKSEPLCNPTPFELELFR